MQGEPLKAVEALGDFPRAPAVNPEGGAAPGVEIHGRRGVEGPPLRLEIAAIPVEHEVLAPDPAALGGEDALSLHGGGNEGHFRHAALLDPCKHQAGVARLQRQGSHRSALLRQCSLSIERPQVVQ